MEQLTEELQSVEDDLLELRDIRVPVDKLKAITDKLYAAKYTPMRMQQARLWIVMGKWPVSKKDLTLDDFYPAKKDLETITDGVQVVTVAYMQQRLNALRTEHQIELSKVRHEAYKTYVNQDVEEISRKYQQQIHELNMEVASYKISCENLTVQNQNLLDKNAELRANLAFLLQNSDYSEQDV